MAFQPSCQALDHLLTARCTVPDTSVIPVCCPHCGTSFVIDLEQETVTNADPEDRPNPDAVPAVRPVCPVCLQRVTVRV
jgi:hypothetical protein